MGKLRSLIDKVARLVAKAPTSEDGQTDLVDWGVVSTTSPTTRRIDVEVSAPSKVLCTLDGLRVEPDVLPSAGRYQLNLQLDVSLLVPNAIIEAGLIIESDDEERYIRVTGSVDDVGLESAQTSSAIMDKPWGLIHRLEGYANRVYDVAFAQEGQVLVSGGDDCRLTWWDPHTGEQVASTQESDSEVRCLGASRDGRLIAVGLRSGTISVWEAYTHQVVWSKSVHQGYISGLCFSPDSTLLVAGSGDRSISVLNASTGTLLYPSIKPSAEKAGVVTSVALSANGLVLASSSQIGNKIMLWEVRTGKLLRELDGHRGTVWTLAFSLDGYLLASGSGDATVRLWDTETGQVSSVLEGFRKDVFCVAMSPDGKLVATASAEPKVRVWQVASGSRLASIESGNRWIRRLVFSPRQDLLVGASDDGRVYVWAVSEDVA